VTVDDTMESKIKKTVISERMILRVYEPGNCTSYQVLFQKIPGRFSSVLGAGDEESTLISILNMPATPFLLPSYSDVPYVNYFMEKTGLGEADAQAICDLIEWALFSYPEGPSSYRAEEGFGPS